MGKKKLYSLLSLIIMVSLCITSSVSWAAQVTVAWDQPLTNQDGTPLADLAGYQLYYGQSSRNYQSTIDVGNQTSYTLSGLEAGQTYYFAVTAYDTFRNESDFSNEVSVTIPSSSPPAAPPVAGFSATPVQGTAPLTVQFTETSTGEISSRVWNFGDGATSTTAHPSHTYTGAGTYTVTLTVTGPGGSDTETKTGYITVTDSSPSSTVQIWLEAEGGGLRAPMQISSNSQASGRQYIWVPNGTGNVWDPTQTGGEAVYTFVVPVTGTYLIWGRVISNNGEDDSFFVSVDNSASLLWDTERGGTETWVWDRISNRGGADPALFTLNAGTHTLRIAQREDGTKLDKLLITDDLGFIPTGSEGNSSSSTGLLSVTGPRGSNVETKIASLIGSLNTTDTDGDGLSDTDEINLYGTNPFLADTDKDGLRDGEEVTYWENAWDADDDGDGITNLFDTDSDGDGFFDGFEVEQGTDPSDPFSIPFATPIIIEAEDYNTGGEGVGYHDTTRGNTGGAYRQDDVDIEPSSEGGFYVGWTAAGEWLAYEALIDTPGVYEFALRIARGSRGTGAIHLEIDGINVTGSILIPNTGGWQQWETLIQPGIVLTPGWHEFVLYIEKGEVNIDWFQFTLIQEFEEVFAVNAGGPAYIDTTGTIYQADNSFIGGKTSQETVAIAETEDDPLYQTERYGNFSYAIPVPNGDYMVTLRFAEIKWSTAGKRIFAVKIEGEELLSNIDLVAQVGPYSAYDVIVPVSVLDGVLDIEFQTEIDNAQVSAIVVTALE